jgi:hypothetical protein
VKRATWLGLMCLMACADAKLVRDVQPWPELTALFQNDARWVGGDGAYSCDLGNNRVLWLFGDSLIAKDSTRNRDTAWFIRNSGAIQTGYNPASAFMAFYWGQRDGHPGSLLPEQDDRWFWPGTCVRVGKGLVIFGQWLRQEGAGQFGFGTVGSAAFFVTDADVEPLVWQPQEVSMTAAPSDVIFGTAGLAYGDFLYVYGTKGDFHDYVLARFRVADAAKADLTQGEFYADGGWRAAASGAPQAIFANGAPESSVHYDAASQTFRMLQSEGFGATTLAYRTAPNPEGPWSNAVSFYRPPESYEAGAFVYAGKGHPEIAGGGLAVSYVPSRFEDDPRPSPPDYYFPHFVRVSF